MSRIVPEVMFVGSIVSNSANDFFGVVAPRHVLRSPSRARIGSMHCSEPNSWGHVPDARGGEPPVSRPAACSALRELRVNEHRPQCSPCRRACPQKTSGILWMKALFVLSPDCVSGIPAGSNERTDLRAGRKTQVWCGLTPEIRLGRTHLRRALPSASTGSAATDIRGLFQPDILFRLTSRNAPLRRSVRSAPGRSFLSCLG